MRFGDTIWDVIARAGTAFLLCFWGAAGVLLALRAVRALIRLGVL